MRIELDEALMEGVRLAEVTAWLASNGWHHRTAFPRADVLVFDGPLDEDGQPLVVVLPRDRSARGFLDELASGLDLVAAVKGWSLDEVAVAIALPCIDLTRAVALDGRIVGLVDARERDDDERIATLRFDANGRGKLQSARMRLCEADYKVACDAHRDGRTVALKGRLERRGNRWWINDVADFAVVSTPT